MSLPDQPVELDSEQTARFVSNNIVRYLLDQRNGLTLTDLAKIGYVFKPCEWDQFYQLIGYSIEGYQELSRVSLEARERAQAQYERLTKWVCRRHGPACSARACGAPLEGETT